MLNSAKEKILVVDDEPMICKSCKEILEDEGYHVDLAYSGLEGVKKALDRAFDLAIIDMKMPDLSGMALLKRIRGERLDTPVIIITAYSTIETAIEAMKLGAADYIPKPFTPDELSGVVKSVISGETAPAQRFVAGELISKDTVLKALEQQAPLAKYTVAVDIDKCIGCQMCMVDCAAHHAETREPVSYPQAWKLLSESRLFVDLEGPVPVPLLCKQCENAPCATVCPTEAIQVDREYGFKVLDKERCIGCRSCLLSCPFGLISMDGKGKAAQKCDMCMERLDAGHNPICVQVCPRNALSLQAIPEAVTDARKRTVEQMIRSNEERKQMLKLIK